MNFSELARYARIPISLNVKPGNRVLILADTKTPPRIIDALAVAIQYHDGIPAVLVIPRIEINGNEPAAPAAEAILGCDIVIGCCSEPISHTEAVRNGLRNGVRYLAMGSITEDNLTSGAATADYRRVGLLTEEITGILAKGSDVHIATKAGTDLKMTITGRKALCFSGAFSEVNTTACFPDGESAISPIEGTSNGRVVVDLSFHEIGAVREPIVFDIKDGFVTKISGGAEAATLRTVWETRGDKNSGNVAHLSIGTNSRARMVGNTQEQKKLYGGMHIGFGDNLLLGGTIRSRTHMDGIIRAPTLTIDGKTIIEANKFSSVVKNP